MNIALQTWGSNGDIRPLLALAAGLRKEGHTVTLAVSSIDNRSYQAECEVLGINYRQIPTQINFDLPDFAQRSSRMHPLQWLTALLDEAFLPYEADIYAAAQQLVAGHDLLIGHHFLYPLKLAAQLAGKPFVSVTFCHVAIADPLRPAFGFPNLGRFSNHLSWRLLDVVFNWSLKSRLTKLWQAAGLGVPQNILSEYLTSQTLNLVAVDPIFCPTRHHWPAVHQVCGFLEFTADSECWQLPASLQAFIAAGPPPVYMTFGSLQQAVPEWSMDLFLEAVNLAGCRAIIQTSSARFLADTQHEQVYFIGRHPHQPVFMQCAALVHHGGAGTSHAATRAACPSVVVPFMEEQLFWARQLQTLQLAGKPLPAKKVTAQGLAKALTQILAHAQFKQQAEQLSKQMLSSDGVEQALALLASFKLKV